VTSHPDARPAGDLSRFNFVPGAPGPLIVGGSGCFLHTADGRRILDAAGGAIVNNVGHGRAEVAAAVHAAMEHGGYVMPLWPTPNRLRLRDRLVERWLPEGFDHVFFTSGGSESGDSALRLARAYHLACGRPERWKVIGRHPSYHGMTLGTMSVASHSGRRAGYEPMLLEFPKVPWDDPDAVVKVIEQEDPATIAGFLFEPVTGAAGACLVASDDYWRVVDEICHEHDILLISDEVMTGFGRTGRPWGYEHLPVQPDVIYGGKGLGGGYVPMGMVATSARVAAPLVEIGGFMFFTFSGSDAMCAGADAVLEIVEREGLVERAAVMGERLARRLHEELDDHPNVLEIRGRGLMLGVELVAERNGPNGPEPFPRDAAVASKVVAEAMARDMWIYPAGSGPVRDGLMIGCPFVIDEEEIELLVTTLRASIDATVTSHRRSAPVA
jgi:adenosylmethionine-8-amino-7-oxononanoate aminotransferase